MIIDSHQHYWKLQRNDYGWLTPNSGLLYSDFLPEDLKGELKQYGIDKTIVVQAAPTIAETEFLLELAREDNTIAGVVGWLDFEADDFREQFERLRQYSKFIGVRPMIQDLPDDWILQKRIMSNIQHLIDHKFPMDLQLRPRHLTYILKLLEQFPDLKAVIDHLAKPFIHQGSMDPWKEYMEQIATYQNVMCKLSGFVPEYPEEQWHPKDALPYIDHVTRVFGTNRVMFGSDWPVCLHSVTYGDVFQTVRDYVSSIWGTGKIEAVFGLNAATFYQLPTT